MQHFPIFVNLDGRRVVVSGGGEAAIAKLRLLLKTQARITVMADDIDATIQDWVDQGRITHIARAMAPGDALCATLFYAANDDAVEDGRVVKLARRDGAFVNWVDNLEQSAFITPAIVDRDPVTVAIGTEGAAPVLARAIKRDLEDRLPTRLGPLARIGKTFRAMADVLPMGRVRRDFWSDFYFGVGPKAFEADGENGARVALDDLLADYTTATARTGHVDFVGAGPGDPELLTLKARRVLHEADVVLFDRLVSPDILELARREALMLDVGKTAFGPSMPQDQINKLIVEHVQTGAQVVRLKSGDATVFGRLDEELDVVEAAGLSFAIIPGITAASGAVAALGRSMTRRHRNTGIRFLTGHDMDGFADQDWRSLASPGQVAAIYMGKRASRFIQGRLMMYGAAPDTPVSLIANVSRADQQIASTTLSELPDAVDRLTGPAVLIYGLSPRKAALAAQTLPHLNEEFA
ncbi:MAG: siroheme synthase CysG [Pseudomonadota bacterium]